MKPLLLIVFSICFISKSLACDCKYAGNFLKATESSNTILKVKVLEHISYPTGRNLFDDIEAIKVEVLEVIRGVEIRKTIEIMGSDGVDCLSPVYFFENNKTYVISIFSYEKNRKTTLSIWGCSEQWLEYFPETNKVKGRIKGKSQNRRIRTYDYDRLIKKLKNK